MSFNWKDTLASVAPVLATALGGPMAGGAVKVLAQGLLGRENATELEVSQAIAAATPADLAKIKKIDNDFKVEMEKLGFDLEKLVIEDRKDARGLAKANMIPHIVLSAIFISGYFAMIYTFLVSGAKIDPASRDTVSLLLGVMTAAIPMIMQFWFGSSQGSKDKTAKMKF